MINEQIVFCHSYKSVQKFATWQEYGYTTGSLIDYNYFKNYYQMIAIQQTDFTGNIGQQATMFFITEKSQKAILDF